MLIDSARAFLPVSIIKGVSFRYLWLWLVAKDNWSGPNFELMSLKYARCLLLVAVGRS